MPDAEGGDELFANGNIVPLTMAGAAYQKGGQPEENEPDAGQQVTEENEPDDTDEGQDGEEQGGGE